MNNRFTSLLRKELLDAVRDKRSVMAGLYYAFFTPVLLAVVLTAVINKATNPEDIEITITNGIEASNLVNYLSDRGISQGDDPDKLKNIELVISTDFSKQLNRAEPAEVTLIADQSEDSLRTAIARIKRALGSYSSEMVSLRLISRGINPNIINPIKVHIQDQATAVSKGGQIMGVMTMLMILSVFVAGMNLAIDTSAGERERNSLALLLSHPVSVLQLVMSKTVAVSIFGMLGLILTIIVSKFVYPFVPWQELGFSVDISGSFVLGALLAGFSVAIFAASMQLFVSFMAKSFKEAQTYISFVMFVPIAMSYAATLDFAVEELRWAPVSGQLQALIDLAKGKEIPLLQLAVSCLSTLIISLALIFGMERLLKSEKIVFGL
ncbi:ABC transporter permease subunit [Porticoccaceae bacterium]|jgi:sodium transport system permease protein|nr:transporter [Porticoccaceae bacterium]MDA7571688.1 ABC transporter permease subunit [Porticoccaceae bacterium]MDA7769154.1 ABC transporter permease subunit [Porticoccaceae bacterium]MDA8597611.1 ABC transporter permease subunit [Porticoccaceae bacterium]MDA8879084.1 ABC transporter permease subunit [Porticoccaceae bacterium]|tara:strand:- start:592 stop:1731 length:1140 start_codon:yes stop_codon:yes gene_type:complete